MVVVVEERAPSETIIPNDARLGQVATDAQVLVVLHHTLPRLEVSSLGMGHQQHPSLSTSLFPQSPEIFGDGNGGGNGRRTSLNSARS